MKSYFLKFPIIISMLFITPLSSFAYREINKSSLEIAKLSHKIVLARCISSKSSWDENKNFIYTYTKFRILHTIKGKIPEDEFTLRVIGGQVDNHLLYVQDNPEINEDQEYLLFLGTKNKDGFSTMTSLRTGVLKVEVDPVDGSRFVILPQEHINFSKDRYDDSIKESTKGKMTLDDFIQIIEDSIESGI